MNPLAIVVCCTPEWLSYVKELTFACGSLLLFVRRISSDFRGDVFFSFLSFFLKKVFFENCCLPLRWLFVLFHPLGLKRHWKSEENSVSVRHLLWAMVGTLQILQSVTSVTSVVYSTYPTSVSSTYSSLCSFSLSQFFLYIIKHANWCNSARNLSEQI